MWNSLPRFTLVLDLRIFPFLFHISGGYEPARLVFGCLLLGLLARVFSSYSEFIQGDLCLWAHTAPEPVQKKTYLTILVKTRKRVRPFCESRS